MISKILFSNILSWLPLLVDRGWLLWFWPSCGGIQMTVSSWILNIQLVSLILSGLGLAGQGVLARPVCQSGSPLFIFFLFSWLRKVQKLFFLWLPVLHNQPMCVMHPVRYIVEPSNFLVAQWHGMLGVGSVLSCPSRLRLLSSGETYAVDNFWVLNRFVTLFVHNTYTVLKYHI